MYVYSYSTQKVCACKLVWNIHVMVACDKLAEIFNLHTNLFRSSLCIIKDKIAKIMSTMVRGYDTN